MEPTTGQHAVPGGYKFPDTGNPCRPGGRLALRQVWVLALIAGVVFAAVRGAPSAVSGVTRGEFGGDLNLLSSFCSGPRSPEESNYYVDMWAGRNMEQIVRMNGLTNNHALFVNSHGTGGQGASGNRFAFYPHSDILHENRKTHFYSVRDLATVLGPQKAAAIQNIYIAACDLEKCFSATEIKRFFPNVTSVVHTPTGKAGYQAMFYESIVNPSREIQPLYEIKVHARSGEIGFEVGTDATPGARKLHPYVADLFLPAGKRPYRTQVAGRELLAGNSQDVIQGNSQSEATAKLEMAASRHSRRPSVRASNSKATTGL
jgi:hypothetical protein